MKNFQQQVIRSAVQSVYWRDYRYSINMRGTLLDFMYDVIPLSEAELNNSCYELEEFENPEWLRRYFDDYRQKETGRCIYTVPKPERYKAVMEFVEEKGFLTQAALADHAQSAQSASLMAAAMGFDCYAEQELLSGTFRGTLLGSNFSSDGLQEYVLLCHFVPGEAYFRVRLFEAFYQNQSGEDQMALIRRHENMDWDGWTARDGFAAFAPNPGNIFLLSSREEIDTTGYKVGDIAFDNTGRRALSFNAHPDCAEGSSIRFKLCQQPDDIDRSLQILRQISAEMDCPLAAE